MNERLSRRVAELLSHRAGFLLFNLFTAAWFALTFAAPAWLAIPLLPVLVVSLAAYLDVVTWFSSATQFTLAYQNQKSEHALELALRNMTDLMRLTVALAEDLKAGQDDIDQKLSHLKEGIR